MLETNAADECASIFLGFQQHIHTAVIHAVNMPFSKVITKKQLIEAHYNTLKYDYIKPIHTIYASSIMTKSHHILWMTLLTSNTQNLIINKKQWMSI